MTWRRFTNPAFLLSIVMLVGAAVSLQAAIRFFDVHLSKAPIHPPGGRQVRDIPRQTRNWTMVAEQSIANQAVLEELGTKNYVTRSYVRRDSEDDERPIALELHLAYYTGMIDTVPHVPERCMVGGGLQIVGGSRRVPLRLDTSRWRPESRWHEQAQDERIIEGVHRLRKDDGTYVRLARGLEDAALQVTEFADPRSGATLLAGYFFIANGAVATTAEEVRLQAFQLDSKYAFYLKIQVSSAQVETAEELSVQASSLLDELLGEIMDCVPDWVEVQLGNYPETDETAS